MTINKYIEELLSQFVIHSVIKISNEEFQVLTNLIFFLGSFDQLDINDSPRGL